VHWLDPPVSRHVCRVTSVLFPEMRNANAPIALQMSRRFRLGRGPGETVPENSSLTGRRDRLRPGGSALGRASQAAA
jgi:hypothetical protein